LISSWFQRLWQQRVKLIFRLEYFIGYQTSEPFDTVDSERFRKVRNRLIEDHLVRFREFIAPPLVLPEQLALAHDQQYLQRVSEPIGMARALGIPLNDPFDDSILEYFRAVTGGTVFGLREAMREPQLPVFNLGGGFHHAHRDRAEGFCLYNDVVTAINCQRRRSPHLRALVIDLDYHQGNGILESTQKDEKTFFFSMQALKWQKIEKSESLEIDLPAGTDDRRYLSVLRKNLPEVFASFPADVVIYLAGADPFIEDILCDYALTAEGMLTRDMFVYDLCQQWQLPLLVLAAGGYGQRSWWPYYRFIANVIRRGKR
jgi:acetoin utilization deacetylase AcuC-like enzyme